MERSQSQRTKTSGVRVAMVEQPVLRFVQRRQLNGNSIVGHRVFTDSSEVFDHAGAIRPFYSRQAEATKVDMSVGAVFVDQLKLRLLNARVI